MLIEFDPAKDAANRAKHGIGLGEYAAMDFAHAHATMTVRGGELRYIVVGPIAGRLHVAIVTYQAPVTRVISLRKANAREIRAYEAHQVR